MVSLSRSMWKNDDRSTSRANSIRMRPTPKMPISDQICDAGAVDSDFTTIQTRNPAAAMGSTPSATASHRLVKTRRR